MDAKARAKGGLVRSGRVRRTPLVRGMEADSRGTSHRTDLQAVEIWVQSWVQLEGLFQPILVRKLRQINESLIGYEPEGREFESLRAHHSSPLASGI